MSTQSDVARKMAPWIRLLAAGVRSQPRGDIRAILDSPELSAMLGRSLGQARLVAEDGLARAWPVLGSPYRAGLGADIAWAYGWAPGRLRDAAVSAFGSVPPEQRAAAVSDAVVRAAWELGMRNASSVMVARTRRWGEQALDRAGPGQKKIWITRDDSRVCKWCRLLARLPAIPVDQEFSYGSAAGQPPRVYRDLLCPPAHIGCRCRLMLVRSSWVRLTPPGDQPQLFMTAEQVRDIPAVRYHALLEFQAAALCEFGQVLRRLAVRGGENVAGKARKKFPRREVAIRRAEWVVAPPDPAAEGDEYDRYETDRLKVMNLIKAECGESTPRDLRVIETPSETIISYELQRVVLVGR